MSLQGNATGYTLVGKISGVPKVDATLTKAGAAADAKATGDALKQAREDLDTVDAQVALAKKYADDAAKAAELAAKAEAASITPADIGAATEAAVQTAQDTANTAVVNAALAHSAATEAHTAADTAQAAAENAQATADAAMPKSGGTANGHFTFSSGGVVLGSLTDGASFRLSDAGVPLLSWVDNNGNLRTWTVTDVMAAVESVSKVYSGTATKVAPYATGAGSATWFKFGRVVVVHINDLHLTTNSFNTAWTEYIVGKDLPAAIAKTPAVHMYIESNNASDADMRVDTAGNLIFHTHKASFVEGGSTPGKFYIKGMITYISAS